MIVTAGCGPSDRDIALDLEQRIIATYGQEPTTRELLEREANVVNDVADTVLLTWVDADLGGNPEATIVDVMTEAGFEVTGTVRDPTPSDPRNPPSFPQIKACDPEHSRAGATATYGPSDAGELVLVIEAGGPPATVGCI